jgi:hypothetical protein
MDDEMRYAETDTPCIPKNWNLSDDLGMYLILNNIHFFDKIYR